MKIKNLHPKTCNFICTQAILLFVLLFAPKVFSAQQNADEEISPGGKFDTVFDRFGNKHAVKDLAINKLSRTSGELRSLTTNSCVAGMFELYFDNGSGMELTTNAQHVARRQTLTEVFQNISGLLNYNASYPASARVKIVVVDPLLFTAPTPPAASGVLGVASAYYLFPLTASVNITGISRNLVEQTIQKRSDAWKEIIYPMASVNSGGYFHARVAFNFANTGFNWNVSSTALATATQIDFYTVALHEITHALGFASLIGTGGQSIFSGAGNYFSAYDRHLVKKVGTSFSPLISSSTNTCSVSYPITIQTTSLDVSPNCSPSYQTDVTNCTTAIVYSHSPMQMIEVYTPDCFEAGSSLSHFEDMCFPNSNPANNNLYFTMSNAGGFGQNKRYLKEEERTVLCDLGYQVAGTYTSNALGASYTYTSGACNGSKVWGKNDGLVNGNFIYTSSGGSVVIPIFGPSGLISNDSQGANPVTNAICVELVSGSGQLITAGSNVIFTPTGTNGGLFLLRYTPVTVNGQQGDITYVYGFVYPSYCGAVNPCDLVQNGGFENSSSCGAMPLNTSTITSCWLACTLSPDVFKRSCNSGTMSANLGTNTYSSSTVFNSYNGSPNNVVMGFGAYTDVSGSEMVLSESAANYMSAPVVNGQVYTLSFWAYQFSGSKYDPFVSANGLPALQTFNSNSLSVVLSFAIDNAFTPSQINVSSFPYAPLTTIKSVTLQNVFNVWRQYTTTFTASCAYPGQWLYVGPDKVLTQALKMAMFGQSASELNYTLIDDISLVPASQTAQSTLPSKLCLGQSLTDLEQYYSIPGGTCSGPGISTATVAATSGIKTIYNLNAAQTLTAGLYSIIYTFTNSLGCVKSVVSQIKLGNEIDGISLLTFSDATCINTVSVNVSNPLPGNTYTWLPSMATGTAQVFSPAAPSVYTVISALNPTCALSGTVAVYPALLFFSVQNNSGQVCLNSPCQLSAVGNFTAITWQPGNYQTPVINFTPSTSVVYSITAVNGIGCVANATFAVVPKTPPAISIQATNTLVCIGQQVTLTATGGIYYSWGGISTQSTIVVAPQVSTYYSVAGTGTNYCNNSTGIFINIQQNTISVLGNTAICAGESTTLSVNGNFNTYTWQGLNNYSSQVSVSPQATTIYTVNTTQYSAAGNCARTGTVQIVVNACTLEKNQSIGLQTLKVFPNPARDYFTIQNLSQQTTDLKITDATGRTVFAGTMGGSEENKFMVEDFAAGLYLITCGNTITKLIVLK